MADQRVVKMAKLLVDYSLNVEKGDYLSIEASDVSAPLIREVYREAIRKGSYVDVNVNLPGISEIFYKEASDEQLTYVKPINKFAVENYTKILSIWGGHNLKTLSNVDPTKMQKRSTANREINIKFMEKMMKGELGWCGTQFPTHSDAQEANMSLEEYEDFVYGAILLDREDPVAEWRAISKRQDDICKYLEGKKNIHVISKDTDLRMRVEGRRWINCDCKLNVPDGEVFTTPIENSVEGHIRFSYPGIYNGKEIEDIRLEFKEGKVVNASAAKGDDLLLALLDTDEGSRILGEFAIGTNYGIQKFTKNMLFDEKIGGTIHAAIGSVPMATGGTNQSGIHWDMLCNMKDGGEIYADGELIYKDGRFVNWNL
ncbi:MAG: peptidase, partial [Clostridiales bacterium]|jgi:aminopeptidase|nr:peptidase [Clostridiales bacterium]